VSAWSSPLELFSNLERLLIVRLFRLDPALPTF
jgi:hypothetical protein